MTAYEPCMYDFSSFNDEINRLALFCNAQMYKYLQYLLLIFNKEQKAFGASLGALSLKD